MRRHTVAVCSRQLEIVRLLVPLSMQGSCVKGHRTAAFKQAPCAVLHLDLPGQELEFVNAALRLHRTRHSRIMQHVWRANVRGAASTPEYDTVSDV